jgi:CO/xanthine dehydrogenase Mo-binding subunit
MKGFAEAPSMATAPAILNAIYDAVGIRIHDLPADKEKVRIALEAKKL